MKYKIIINFLQGCLIFFYFNLFATSKIFFQSKNKSIIKKNMTYVCLKNLDTIDMHKFIGKRVKFLMSNSIISKYNDRLFMQGKPAWLNYLSLGYSNHLYIHIYVKEYVFIKPFNLNLSWKLKDFEKEKISQIEIEYNDKIVKRFY